MEIKGLSLAEVAEKKNLGLSNEVTDSYNASYITIFFRNIFSLINIVLFPLLLALLSFSLYIEVLTFSTFLIINTLVSIIDEIRVKRKLDKLKSEFQIKTIVIREGVEIEIPVSEIVQGDYVKAKDGDGIIADGEIVFERYLQVDESILTGESNYLKKEISEKVLSGSYVVTGECIYVVETVGNNNYLNKLGSEAVKIKEERSPIQKSADKIILFLTISAISVGLLNYLVSLNHSGDTQRSILSLTTVIALIIPQTLIFLYTLTYTISITKLFSKGILVQKGGSIEELSNVNVICFDKTGTITTNKMKIVNTRYFNLDNEVFGSFYNSNVKNLVSVNETQRLLNEEYKDSDIIEVNNFDQIPFSSKTKYSLICGESDEKMKVILLGAFNSISKCIDKEILNEIGDYLKNEEEKGFRVLTGIYKEFPVGKFDISNPTDFISENIVVFTIEENLNPGIKEILSNLSKQGIAVKIISGDSKTSVSRICQKIDIDTSKIIDLSERELSNEEFDLAVSKMSVFTRAKPEDKLKIITALNNQGFRTAMVGDGINDVLGLKASKVSIAMESGSKITREISDIVLLNNDYSKIPDIFFEGSNIIFNLRMSTKIFLTKSIFALLISIFYTLNRDFIPLHPSSTLIFSFLGSSAPSYVLIFTRQKVESTIYFFRDVIRSSLPTALVLGVIFISFHQLYLINFYDYINSNTALVLLTLALSLIYSLYLVWEAKKIRNLILPPLVFSLLLTIGTFQTILPIDFQDSINANSILLALMGIGGILLYLFVFRKFKTSNIIIRFLLFILAFIWIPVVSIFPFRSYYNVTRIPLDLYFNILLISFIGLISIVLVNKIMRRIISE